MSYNLLALIRTRDRIWNLVKSLIQNIQIRIVTGLNAVA